MKLLAIALTLLIANAASQEVRLSKALVPEHYGISIKTYLDEVDGNRRFSFDGESTVTIRCVTATNQIVMHARDLTIDIPAIQVKREPSGSAIPVTGVTQDQSRETMTISLSTQLASNDRVSVLIRYLGNHRTDLTGFFRTSYQQDNQTRILAAAHMQPNAAHTVFPCFDEPPFKANFTLTIQYRQGRRVWSNMPARSERDLGTGWKETIFSTSPPMSTYVFSIFVADFQCLSKSTSGNVQVSVCARPDAVYSGQIQFALNEAVSHFQFYEKYLEVSLPLPKYDLMVVPNYLQFGVENWGIPFFGEGTTLTDPLNETPQRLRASSNLIAHEIVHQWDGDLVTFDWWNDFWLKEGAAIWFHYLGSAASQPTWNHEQLVLEVGSTYAGGSFVDAQESSRPLNYRNITLATMQNYFLAFNFDKGASLIRMLHGSLGDNTFRKGFGNFFRARAYGTATADDLWQALTEQARRDNTLPPTLTVKDVMDTWTEQPGHPVLKASRKPDGTLDLNQLRFVFDPKVDPMTGAVAPFNFKWWLPVSWASSANGQIQRQRDVQWMGPSSAPPRMYVGPSPNWYLVNLDAYGYYRVQYENDNWLALAQQLRVDRNPIPTLTRAQLLYDAFALNRAELLSPTVFLSFMSSMKLEQEYIVWSACDLPMSFMKVVFENRVVFRHFKQFFACQLTDQMSRIDMESSESFRPLQSKYKRQLIVTRACNFGVTQCVAPALKLWSAWRRRPEVNPIPEDIRSDVYCTAVREGSTEDWNFAHNKIREAGYPENDARALRQALACTTNAAIQNYLLNALKQNALMQPFDAIEMLGFLLDSPSSHLVTWSWLKENKQWVQQQLATKPIPFMRTIGDVLARKLVAESDLAELKKFESLVVNDDGAEAIFNETVLGVAGNVRWRTLNEDILVKALIDFNAVYKCASAGLDATKLAIVLSLLFNLSLLQLFR